MRLKIAAVAALCTVVVAGCQTTETEQAASDRTVDLRPGTYTAPFADSTCGKLRVGTGGVIQSYKWGKCLNGLGRMTETYDTTVDSIRVTPANNIIIGRATISQVTTPGDCLRGNFYIEGVVNDIKHFCRR